jgi:hypothetical protein
MINPQEVEGLYAKCASSAGDQINSVFVHTLDKGRLNSNRPAILAMLSEMDDSFMDDGGGGMSFLNLCQDRHGALWTGMHQTCDRLLAMGVGLGLVEFPFPRELWDALPGALPYVQIKRSLFKVPA